MPTPQFKRQDLIFLILPNEGEIFQNIQDEVKMLDVEVEKKCLCKIPFTPGRGQTGATIWFILRQKGFKMQRVAKLSGHHFLIIFSLLFNSFLSSKLTFIVLSSSIRLSMKFFHAVLCGDGKNLLDSLSRVLKYFKERLSLETFWQHALWPSRPLRPQQPSSWPIIPFAKNKIHVEVYSSAEWPTWKGTLKNVLSMW